MSVKCAYRSMRDLTFKYELFSPGENSARLTFPRIRLNELSDLSETYKSVSCSKMKNARRFLSISGLCALFHRLFSVISPSGPDITWRLRSEIALKTNPLDPLVREHSLSPHKRCCILKNPHYTCIKAFIKIF